MSPNPERCANSECAAKMMTFPLGRMCDFSPLAETMNEKCFPIDGHSITIKREIIVQQQRVF